MDKDKLWQTVLENLKLTLSSANFGTWFPQTFINQIKPVDQKHQIVEIATPSTFIKDTIENRYYGLLKEALDKTTEKKNDLIFVVKQQKQTAKIKKNEKGTLFAKIEFKKPSQEAILRAGLRPDFNFENFAVNTTNQMAHAAARAVADSPGKGYNPLFLYGGVGVGKTHLMQAIGTAVLERRPRINIIYCMGEEFTTEIVDAIRKKTTKQFKDKYRSAKILLIDDIQFIAGKIMVQEEFFHTFNAIWRAGGQIVMTSDRRPDEISNLESRLRSRFEGGLTIDIQDPDFELRTAIVLIKSQQRKIKLPMDIAQLIASNVTSTRRLEGFLVRLATEAKTKNEPLTPELASALLGMTNAETLPKKLVKPKEILGAVANYYGFKNKELLGPRRPKKLALARQVLMYLLRTELKMPLMDIGQFLNNRDHTTVMYGVDKITHFLPESEELRVEMVGIKQKLYG
ncbi:MAG: chromosomal replication initiator protein DnaA [Candidatus Marinimicrobia bacterium]|nr:chromosomal replication initiator protein DnaA [Candidatus Neomarinimicrobiota bacterium]